MSEDTPQNQDSGADSDHEGGGPIRALRDLEIGTSSLFLRGVRRRIHRRTTASQLLAVSWRLPGIVFGELTSMLVHIIRARDSKKER